MAKAARAAPTAAEPAAPVLETPAQNPASAAPAPPALAVPTPVTPPAPVEPSQPDLFDAAFAEAAAAAIAELEKPPPEATVPRKPPPAAPKPPAAPPAEPVVEPAPEPVAPPPPPPPPAPSPVAQSAPPQPQPQPQPQPRAYQEPPLFNPEEATQLQSFYSEWPDVARATEVMIRGLLAQTARRMYADMASSLAPYLQTIDILADRSQLSELQGQVSDYDTVSGQLTSWASRQPAYLRTAYEHVIKSGTAAEVVDLINRYKQDTMPAQPATPAAAAAQPAAVSPAPVNPALAAAAARLAPVATKRTNVVAPPTDFDTAFAEFAKAS